ncbi:MAG TPA: hypothetical protein VKA77_11065 [Mycobacterium sp.]|nr:hypothetical protein [Mycobacterium sp.]
MAHAARTRNPQAGRVANIRNQLEEKEMMTHDGILHAAQRYQEDDSSILRWGGLAGIGGSVLLVVVFALVAIFAGPEPAGLAGPISRFPEIRVARTVENGLYLAALALWVLLALALFRTLRRTRPASALFGSALNIFGLAVLAAGAIPHVVTSRLSDLYHADGVRPDDQATLVLLWQANQAMFDALLLVGLLVMPVGVILFGVAMRQDPAFGKVAGNVSVALGVVGLAAATVMLVDPLSAVAAVGIFALIGFHLVAGWKTYRLSTA